MSMQNIRRPPSEYLRSLYYDSCVYSPEVLEALIRRVGADRIVLGTDYPFGESDPVAEIRKCAGLTPDGVEAVVSRTPAAILDIMRSARTAD
jgi:aminocarboxymuconate-semialdehyde decarboxylase